MRTCAISLWALLGTVIVTPSQAQQSVGAPDANVGPQCGGQYECVEDRPLSSAEAERSIAHPARRSSVEQQTSAHHSGHPSKLAGASAYAPRPSDSESDGSSQ